MHGCPVVLWKVFAVAIVCFVGAVTLLPSWLFVSWMCVGGQATGVSQYDKPDELKTEAEKALPPCPWQEFPNPATGRMYVLK